MQENNNKHRVKVMLICIPYFGKKTIKNGKKRKSETCVNVFWLPNEDKTEVNKCLKDKTEVHHICSSDM